MTAADLPLFLLILLMTAIGYIGFIWAIRAAATWMLSPSPEPDPRDEMAVAVHDLQVALGEAIRPPLQKLTDWLARKLPS